MQEVIINRAYSLLWLSLAAYINSNNINGYIVLIYCAVSMFYWVKQ